MKESSSLRWIAFARPAVGLLLFYKLYKNLVETRVIYKDMEEEILLEKKKRDGL